MAGDFCQYRPRQHDATDVRFCDINGRKRMSKMMRHAISAAAWALLFAGTAAFAQQPTVRVAGTITGVDGPAIVVKAADGEVKVNLAEKLLVIAQEKGSPSDIK